MTYLKSHKNELVPLTLELITVLRDILKANLTQNDRKIMCISVIKKNLVILKIVSESNEWYIYLWEQETEYRKEPDFPSQMILLYCIFLIDSSSGIKLFKKYGDIVRIIIFFTSKRTPVRSI